MKTILNPFFLSVFTCFVSVFAQKDYGVHDPSTIVKENDRYYTFYTSNGVEYAYSSDLCTWQLGGKIFRSGFPQWITSYVSSFAGHFWAPDVFYMNNRWHVYYSCSSFGSRQSAIGLATSPSLSNPQWNDEGMVVYTNNSSDHNAIDPAIIRHDGKVWMVYGSFWSGIVMTEIDSTTGKPINRNALHYLANNDPEAACVIHHGNYYYLFFNRGKCCDGVKSTYYINVGRSPTPTGPYLDKNGNRTSNGGGTVILKTEGRFIGPGHFGFFSENGKEYMSYHFYDASQNGTSKLKISTLLWQDGWPVVNTDFDPCIPDTAEDCAGVKGGSAYIDNCGVCAGGTTGKLPCQRDCNGDWGGSAFVDTCGTCAGGKTGLVSCSGLLQCEDALEFDGVFENTNDGFIGKGYLNLTNEKGSAVTISLCTDISSDFPLTLRYANGSATDRTLSVSVNDTIQIDSIIFPSGSSWTDWKSARIALKLLKGNNLITFTSLSDEGGPNLDLIAFSDKHLHDCAIQFKETMKPQIRNFNLRFSDGFISCYTSKEITVSYQLYNLCGQTILPSITRRVKPGINHLKLNTASAGRGVYLFVLEEKDTGKRYEKIIHTWQ